MRFFVAGYKRTVKPVAEWLLARLLRYLDGRRWMPVFFLLLTRVNTNDTLFLHVLNNVRVKTGRKVIVITAWPFWPRETGTDPFHRSFFRELTPDLSYVWITGWMHRLIQLVVPYVLRVFQIQEAVTRPMGLHSTFRYSDASSIYQSDVLNQNGKVFMQIPQSHEHVFQDRLRDLGVGPGQWFVCVHARENGWTSYTRAYGQTHPEGYRPENDEYRNVDIKSYFPAIEYITSLGGMVVRMGDPSMIPVNGIDGLIDYPFTRHRSLPMDLYLVARSRFVIGCDAGFSTAFPLAFGKPLLVTNLGSPVVSAFWPYENHRIMLQGVVESATGRVLSLPERSHPRLSTVYNTVTFRDMGYHWEPNTAQEILDSTVEMVDLVEREAFGGPMTEEQEYFHRCRQEAVASMWPLGGPYGDPKWSQVQKTESRISAAYGAKHLKDEAHQANMTRRRTPVLVS